jgi:hypothetical protein
MCAGKVGYLSHFRYKGVRTRSMLERVTGKTSRLSCSSLAGASVAIPCYRICFTAKCASLSRCSSGRAAVWSCRACPVSLSDASLSTLRCRSVVSLSLLIRSVLETTLPVAFSILSQVRLAFTEWPGFGFADVLDACDTVRITVFH